MITFTERHWNKIAITGPNDCWIWTGSCDSRGYGQIRVSRNYAPRVTRVMLAWVDGIEIPDKDTFVLHSCDIPSCVNPMHLRWGSHKENVRDAVGRKRYKNNFNMQGETHWRAKLAENDVIEIRNRHNNGEKKRALSNEYGVSFQTISHIVNRVTWTHI